MAVSTTNCKEVAFWTHNGDGTESPVFCAEYTVLLEAALRRAAVKAGEDADMLVARLQGAKVHNHAGSVGDRWLPLQFNAWTVTTVRIADHACPSCRQMASTGMVSAIDLDLDDGGIFVRCICSARYLSDLFGNICTCDPKALPSPGRPNTCPMHVLESTHV